MTVTPQRKAEVHRMIMENINQFSFEPLEESTYRKVRNRLNYLLEREPNVSEHVVICDIHNNTKNTAKSNSLKVDLAVKFKGDETFTFMPVTMSVA